MINGVKDLVKIVVETRGGYHIVYQSSKSIKHKELWEFAQSTAFFKDNREGKPIKDHWFSITNQPNVIIPGTYQGSFQAKICQNFFHSE